MDERSPKTGFSAGLRGVLSGREPPPSAFIERQPSYPWFVVGTVSIGAAAIALLRSFKSAGAHRPAAWRPISP